MDYVTLQKMNRFAKFWDLYANSGQFKVFMNWFAEENEANSFFWSFFAFCEFLSERFTETHSLSLISLAEQAWLYLKSKGVNENSAAVIIEKDFCFGTKRRDVPPFLKTNYSKSKTDGSTNSTLKNKRQLQHLLS